MRKPKSIQGLTLERLEAMRHRHYRYNPKPFYEMTDCEARGFAMRQAVAASASIPMTMEEMQLYAGTIYAGIRRFNSEDPRHADHMRYLEECRRQAEQVRRAQTQAVRRQRQEEVIIKS